MNGDLESRCPVCEGTDWQFLYRRLGWGFVRCKTCGLARLDPIPSERQLAEHYEKRSNSGNYEPDKADERIPSLKQVLDFAEDCGAGRGRLLDIGCFDGTLLDEAAGRGWQGWGLELQGEAAQEAERRHPGRIFQGPLEGFGGVEPESFQLITAVGLVEHLRDPRRLFSLARRSLRPGGLLVIQTPNRRSWPSRLLGRFWPPVAPPEHTHYFDRRTLKSICARYGLSPVRAKPHLRRLRLGYAYDQFQYFGPEFHRLLDPVIRRLKDRVKELELPFYGGELLYAARRRE
jgi:SAM-dependent methyltransferase